MVCQTKALKINNNKPPSQRQVSCPQVFNVLQVFMGHHIQAWQMCKPFHICEVQTCDAS
jgi:hypothetical protein